MRKEVPQVGGRAIGQPFEGGPLEVSLSATTLSADGARGGLGHCTASLWGYFLFHTQSYAPYRERLRQVFAPSAALQHLAQLTLSTFEDRPEAGRPLLVIDCSD
eukprot:SAG11_NODE_11855_length_735_cov_0.746855_2_plen_103_part_01